MNERIDRFDFLSDLVGRVLGGDLIGVCVFLVHDERLSLYSKGGTIKRGGRMHDTRGRFSIFWWMRSFCVLSAACVVSLFEPPEFFICF